MCLLCFYFFCSEAEVSFCLLHTSKLGVCNVKAIPSKIVVYYLNAKAFIQFDLISNCDSISWSLHYFTFLKRLSYCDHWCIVYAKAAKCNIKILTKEDLKSSQSNLLHTRSRLIQGPAFLVVLFIANFLSLCLFHNNRCHIYPLDIYPLFLSMSCSIHIWNQLRNVRNYFYCQHDVQVNILSWCCWWTI